MLGPGRIVDGEAPAQRIEAGRRPGKFLARHLQGVDNTLAAQWRTRQALELGIEEAHVELGVMDHQRRIADELDQFVGDLGKARLVAEKLGRQTMDGNSVGRHVAFRIDVTLVRAPGRDVIEQFQAGDLDDAVTAGRIETRRFRIEHDLTHGREPLPPAVVAVVAAAPM
jgi:hypothetical protein